MKMAQNNKHLFELLKEDQEPFFLKDYIAHRRCQLLTKTNSSSRPNQNHYSHAKNTKMIKRSLPPITKPKTLPQKLLPKNACFSSTSKSPLFEFPLSPISLKKSPCNRAPTSPILLHIPAKTAALLLEAALRIQKQSSNGTTISKSKSKPKPQKFRLFGSLLKRLTSHRGNKKKEMLVVKSSPPTPKPSLIKARDVNSFDGNNTKCSCSRPSSTSGVWSDQSNEEKSMEFSTSTSETSQSEESVGFVAKLMMMRAYDDDDGDFAFCDESEFCDQSPFRFVLQRSPSCSPLSFSGRRTPDFSSPVASPARRRSKQEGMENYVTENSKGFQVEEELEEEEEKEQFSPVSVLDPPFEDDYDRADEEDHEHEDANGEEEEEEEEDDFDMESSFAIVQRTKNKLLQKLRRFEKLAELDPIELEKRMLEDEEEEDDEDKEIEEKCEETSDLDGFIREVLSKSTTFCHSHHHRGLGHMKRLVSDLIVEEQKLVFSSRDQEEEIVIKGVVERFESWKEVQSNTIDMMVEQDFRKELEAWKDNKEQIGETAIEIELAIFGLLVEELAQELVSLSGN